MAETLPPVGLMTTWHEANAADWPVVVVGVEERTDGPWVGCALWEGGPVFWNRLSVWNEATRCRPEVTP